MPQNGVALDAIWVFSTFDNNIEIVIDSDIKMCCTKVETHPFKKKVKDSLISSNRIISSSNDVIVKSLLTFVREFNFHAKPTSKNLYCNRKKDFLLLTLPAPELVVQNNVRVP